MIDADSEEFLNTLDVNFELFGKGKPARDIQVAWWRLLKGFCLEDIKAAFGKHALECKFMPKPADVVNALRDIAGLRAKAGRERELLAERERVAALPAPCREVDAMAMLADAKVNAGEGGGLSDFEAHEALIAQDKRLGKIRVSGVRANGCGVSHCHAAGGISSSLRGSEVWFCVDHFREV